jgi:hypothetical protein
MLRGRSLICYGADVRFPRPAHEDSFASNSDIAVLVTISPAPPAGLPAWRLEDASGVNADLTVRIRNVATVSHQPADFGK